MSAQQALRAAVERLTAAGVPQAAQDARRLLAEALSIGADRLGLHLSEALPAAAAAKFDTLIEARLRRQPVSQILGRRAFWGRDFRVTPAVLDPRPETETLIAAALAEPFAHVLDLGTGSGAILLTLLAERPGARGLGVDLSPSALEVCAANRAALGLEARADLAVSDWFSQVRGGFDLIVSNPPYIAAGEMPGLSPEVRDWEPWIALTPGGDGLGAYRVITGGAGESLTAGGRLMVEIGPTQGQAVVEMFARSGLVDLRILPDLDGRDRVVIGRRAD